MPSLTTSRYVPPGVYVGEILNPTASNLSADARVPAVIAKGSRYAVAANVPIIRAFISAQELNFTVTPPFLAPLLHVSTGNQAAPNRVYAQDGTELLKTQWAYVADESGKFTQIQINDEVYNPLKTYYIDYQSSDRNVQDPLPIADVRQIRAVGDQTDRSQYKEFSDFYMPMNFTDMQPDQDNVHLTNSISSIATTLQPSSTGVVTLDSGAAYTHPYSRIYNVTALSVAGTSPTRTATFSWSAANASGGNEAVAPVPLHAADQSFQFQIQESVPASLAQDLEFGIILNFSFGVDNFVAGDSFTLVGQGASLVEVDARYSNPQFATIQDPAHLTSGPSAGDLLIYTNAGASYTNARNHNYDVKFLAVSGTTPNRVYSFVWARYGDTIVSTAGTFTVAENNLTTHTKSLADGVKIDFVWGNANPTVGSTWRVVAMSPRLYYSAKDSRTYKLNVATVTTNNISGVTTLTGGYNTDTTEGRFGTFSAAFDPSGSTVNAGYALLPDNVSVAFRNITRFAAQDLVTFGILNSEVIDWSLQSIVTDVRQLTDFQTDMNGAITGTSGLSYVILSQVPTSQDSIQVVNYSTKEDISFNWNVGTPFIYFTTAPGVAIQITYDYRGAEPDPGQTYYVSSLFLRPDAYYNVPFLVLRRQDGQLFSAPSQIDNDLYVGNEIGWDNNAPGLYLVQPKNVDGSGVYSITDFTAAIESVRSYPRITDLCLLNYPSGLQYILNENELACDPFARRPNLVWWGAPIGTPVGDENTQGSLVQLATRSLQSAGQSPSKGTRIMVAPTTAQKTIVLDSGLSTQLTLDGSFVALAAASLVASFADPATDILGQLIVGFDTVQIFTDEENAILGQAQINYVQGTPGVYTWGEDYTVDQTQNFSLIQIMTQRQYVTKVVIRNMGSLIGIVPASTQAGEALVRGQLASILRGLLAQGLIASYQDEDGNERAFDPQKDIIVYQDKSDLNSYYFNYAWFSRNVIKKLLGLYSLNSNDFSDGVALG